MHHVRGAGTESRYTPSGIDHEVRRHFNTKSKDPKDPFEFASMLRSPGASPCFFSSLEHVSLHLGFKHHS
jgi:hypothetical protein